MAMPKKRLVLLPAMILEIGDQLFTRHRATRVSFSSVDHSTERRGRHPPPEKPDVPRGCLVVANVGQDASPDWRSVGADGGTRTRTRFPGTDFKSAASAFSPRPLGLHPSLRPSCGSPPSVRISILSSPVAAASRSRSEPRNTSVTPKSPLRK